VDVKIKDHCWIRKGRKDDLPFLSQLIKERTVHTGARKKDQHGRSTKNK